MAAVVHGIPREVEQHVRRVEAWYQAFAPGDAPPCEAPSLEWAMGDPRTGHSWDNSCRAPCRSPFIRWRSGWLTSRQPVSNQQAAGQHPASS